MNASLGPPIASAVPLDPLADPQLREMLGYVAVSADRLEASGQMPRAVALRADLWPSIREVYGYPVVRLEQSAGVPAWGVLV